ncbi:MAG: YajG family lipoprotein [Sulfurimonas sp.]|nr:YajG family lipoprotein [Sulfurimonas sp.]MDD3834596.1 YajG family lipoprotein [Sulfurimonas sp.]
MRNLLLLLATIVIFSGCSYKNESLMLSQYDAQYTGELAKDKKSVFIESIRDIRVDKRNIGYVLEGDKKSYELYSTEDFSKKYNDALLVALRMAGFQSVAKQNGAKLVVNISIKKIEFIYNNKSFDKNLKGVVELEVTIKRGASTITQNFKQAASKWIAPSYTSKDIEPFLNEIFSQSVNSIVSRLTRY